MTLWWMRPHFEKQCTYVCSRNELLNKYHQIDNYRIFDTRIIVISQLATTVLGFSYKKVKFRYLTRNIIHKVEIGEPKLVQSMTCDIQSQLQCAVASCDVRVRTHFGWNLLCACVQYIFKLAKCNSIFALFFSNNARYKD